MRPPRAKRATSVDVARAAGVSRTTVSFVLNNTAGQTIPEETRRRVLDAARALDYRPHGSARSLAAGRSDIVLFSMPYLPVSASLGRFAEDFAVALAARGLTMIAHFAGVHGRPLADVCAEVNAVAVVGLETIPPETTEALRRAGVESVFSVGSETTTPNWAVGKLQAEHLLSRGHRSLGYALPTRSAPHRMARERQRGVAEACAAEGHEPPAALTVEPNIADAARAVAEWRARSVTAVAAFNDETALVILAGLRRLGLTAPDDLAVIGVDDISAAAFAAPPLTTIGFDLANAGLHLADAVVASLAGDHRASVDDSEPHIIERESA